VGKWSTYGLRGTAAGLAGPVPPSAPDPPLFDPEFTGECGEGETQCYIVPPPDYPEGATSWDLIYNVDIDPPVDAVAINAAPGVPILLACQAAGGIRYALLRAYNAAHDAYTDSSVSSQPI